MTRLRRVIAAVTCAVVVGGCAPDSGAVEVEDLPDIAQETSLTPRSFALQVTNDAQPAAMTVDGRVADDHRYHGRVSFGPGGGYEELVVDDRRWLRVTGDMTDRLAEVARESCPDDEEALAALGAGEWVEDAEGAPGEFERPDVLQPLSPTTVLGVVRAMELLPEALRAADRVREWNPRSATYLEAHDKFERYEEDGLRFDALPPEYDPDRVFRDGVPSPNALAELFTYTSVWVSDGGITRVETLVDIDHEQLRTDVDRVRRLMSEQTGRPLDELPHTPLPQRTRQTLTITPGAPALPTAPEQAPPLARTCFVRGISGPSGDTDVAVIEELAS